MSNVHRALTANIIKTAEICFLSAAQNVMKEAIYLDNMVFETNLRLKNDFTYNILHKGTCKVYEKRLYKNLHANLYKSKMLIHSRMRQLFMFYRLSALLLTFLFLGIELELQFLNHTRGYQKVLSLTWKEPEIWIYSALFFNVVPFQLHTLVPSSFPVINTRSVEVNILVP